MRADSIRLAADPLLSTSKTELFSDAASTLLQQHADLVRTVAPETRGALVDQLTKQYVERIDQDGSPTAVLVLLRTIERSSHIDGDLLRLLQSVVSQSGLSRGYPVTDAIELMVASGVSDPNRIGLILKLHQIQDQLGSCPSATALLLPLSLNASRQLVDAQRLIWNPGMVSKQEVDRRLEVAIRLASSALIAEETVAKTMRRLQVIGDSIATDRTLKVHWEHDRDYVQLQQKSIKAVTAIEQLAAEVEKNDRIRPSQLALIRQTSRSHAASLAENAFDSCGKTGDSRYSPTRDLLDRSVRG